jgi:hypothetical protein
MSKRKYLIPKVAEQGEDAVVDAKMFDDALGALLKSKPIQQKDVRVGKRPNKSGAKRG